LVSVANATPCSSRQGGAGLHDDKRRKTSNSRSILTTSTQEVCCGPAWREGTSPLCALPIYLAPLWGQKREYENTRRCIASSLGFTLSAPVASAQVEDIDSYIALLRTDLLAQRGVLIVNNMRFTEAESEVFWPVYHKYQHELTPIGTDRAALIKDYLANVDWMDDTKAKS
jgi:hypothetical protein